MRAAVHRAEHRARRRILVLRQKQRAARARRRRHRRAGARRRVVERDEAEVGGGVFLQFRDGGGVHLPQRPPFPRRFGRLRLLLLRRLVLGRSGRGLGQHDGSVVLHAAAPLGPPSHPSVDAPHHAGHPRGGHPRQRRRRGGGGRGVVCHREAARWVGGEEEATGAEVGAEGRLVVAAELTRRVAPLLEECRAVVVQLEVEARHHLRHAVVIPHDLELAQQRVVAAHGARPPLVRAARDVEPLREAARRPPVGRAAREQRLLQRRRLEVAAVVEAVERQEARPADVGLVAVAGAEHGVEVVVERRRRGGYGRRLRWRPARRRARARPGAARALDRRGAARARAASGWR